MKIYDKIETAEHSCSCIVQWKRICMGKDIYISIPRKKYKDIVEEDIRIDVIDPRGALVHPEFTLGDNDIFFILPGARQRQLGIYSIRLWIKKGKKGQSLEDYKDVFELVLTTEQENDFENKALAISISTDGYIETPDAYYDGVGMVIINEEKFFNR